MSNDTAKLLEACVEYRAKLDKLERENAALREVLDLTVDRLMFYMECIPMAHKDYIKTLEGKMSDEIVNKSRILLKKEAQP